MSCADTDTPATQDLSAERNSHDRRVRAWCPETADIWDGVRDHLATNSVALRLPGFGSDRPESFGATIDEYTQWLIDGSRRIPGPVDLVGRDIGAMLAYRVVADPTVTVRSWVAGQCERHASRPLMA